ncbi:MAG: hypothetical protein J6V82_04555 [Clostridia bacterium]|nr:hypothetical protein [Clostridia bacterium]MBO7151003.1 hypothetical protein [Clostridia bacterium]
MTQKTDPQQEIFTQVKLDAEAKGHTVYDGFMPPEDAPYPFVYLGDCQEADTDCKNAVYGNVHLTIHFWHNNPRQRGTVSSMIADIKGICRNITKTAHYSWDVRGMSSRIFPDNTTKSPLLHGVLEVDFYFS